MFERPFYQKRYDWDFYRWRGDLGVYPIPEPSTIGFLGLGALGVLATRRIFLKGAWRGNVAT